SSSCSFIVADAGSGAMGMKRSKIRLHLLRSFSPEPILHNTPEHDRQAEGVYLAGEPVLKQPFPLSRRSGPTGKPLNFILGQEHRAPSWWALMLCKSEVRQSGDPIRQ